MAVVARMTSQVASRVPGSAEALRAEVAALKARNEHLRDLLDATQRGNVSMSGYLQKFRPFSLGLFSHEWELRYVMLQGTMLKYYKTERDVHFVPRGQADVQGCFVEWEGCHGGRHWTFGVVDPSGRTLLRLSSDDKTSAERWVDALETAGCVKRLLKHEDARAKLTQSTDFRPPAGAQPPLAPGSPSAAEASAKLQERWETSSADSELPDLPQQRTPKAGRRQRHSASGRDLDLGTTATSASTSAPKLAKAGDRRPNKRGPMWGSSPVHTGNKTSFLSSDGTWIWSKQDGLFNLMAIVTIVTNFRLILENILKYGILLNPVSFVRRSYAVSDNLPVLLCFPVLLLFALLALAAEKLALAGLKRETQMKLAHHSGSQAKDADEALAKRLKGAAKRHELLVGLFIFVNTTATLALPCYVCLMSSSEPAPGILLVMNAIVWWMKLVSYAHCNWDLRMARRNHERRPGERGCPDTPPEMARQAYPENLTLGGLMYFLAAPTLTYQVNFPRSKRLRKRWLLRRVGELLLFCGLLVLLIKQYIMPALDNSLEPLHDKDWLRLGERVLKLSIPNLYAWLCMFYCLFHLWLNILAELLRFGDREFYRDWWNAATLGDYWKLWNLPVHKWLLRTIYFPAVRAGFSRLSAMVLVFFVSAVFHELCLGVPLHKLRFYAFGGIMIQVPLIMLTERLFARLGPGPWGNVMFWVTFCVLGQPVSVMLYYNDYIAAMRGGAV